MNLKKTYKRYRKNRKRTKNHSYKKIIVGGTPLSSLQGMPQINIMAYFSINQEKIAQFSRFFASNTDCVITGLQMMGVFDDKTAEMFRISEHFKQMRGIPGGINQYEIELFCMIGTGYNFDITFYDTIEQWATTLNILPTSSGVFCYVNNPRLEGGHAFIVFKGNDDKLYLIDPQASNYAGGTQIYCELQNSECYKFVSNFIAPYGILSRSNQPLKPENLQTIKEYITRDLPALQHVIANRHPPEHIEVQQPENAFGAMEIVS